MVDKSFHPIPEDNTNSGIERFLRDIPPAHYILQIESFSELSKVLQDADPANVQDFESDVFQSGGFKWKLSLYPNGNKERNGEGHISLYLVIADTDNLPLGWEVNVNFRLFVHDQIQDKYMAIQDANGKVRRFNKMKTEWGFSQLLPLCSLNDATNGYLVHDKCVFGVEVFVLNYSGRGQSLALLKKPTSIYTWKVDNFSSLEEAVQYSDVFTAGDRKWKLKLHPKGAHRAISKSLSLFICLEDQASYPSDRKTFAKYLLRVKDQKNGKHEECEYTACFATESPVWGRTSMLTLTRLHDASTGFLVKNTLIIEAQIECVSTVKNF